jgi:FKBP-type peptidyl-prolyl cis-trans isomerase FkpA
MKKGGSYRLRIPAELGYGAKDSPEIPANSDLEFDVTMHGFMPEEQLRAIMMQQQQGMGLGGPPQGGEGPPPGAPGGR